MSPLRGCLVSCKWAASAKPTCSKKKFSFVWMSCILCLILQAHLQQCWPAKIAFLQLQLKIANPFTSMGDGKNFATALSLFNNSLSFSLSEIFYLSRSNHLQLSLFLSLLVAMPSPPPSSLWFPSSCGPSRSILVLPSLSCQFLCL